MTSMLLAVVVQTALVTVGADAAPAGAETYAVAHRTTAETGKPMVVMVSTDWCPPCQTMKKTILPRVREHGFLQKVSFAMVNPDREGELAKKLTDGGPIPQLVMYRKSTKGWMRCKLVGGQSVEAVEDFIKEGLAKDEADKADKRPASEGESNAPPPSESKTAKHEGPGEKGKSPRQG